MTFDFFNTSDLAFGAKLTAAFKSLNNLQSEAKRNVQEILDNIEIFKEYVNRNYQVPAPIKPTSACRTDEIFNLFKGTCYIKQMQYNKDTQEVVFAFTLFETYNKRITIAEGSSKLNKGFVFAKKAISNKDMVRPLRISDKNNKEGSEFLLFEYTVDKDANGSNGRILIKNWDDILLLRPYDASQYSKMSMKQIEGATSPYTASKNECVMITLRQHFGTDGASVKVNGTVIYKLNNGVSSYVQDHIILYLREGDKLEFQATAYAYLFKIMYD